MPTYFMVLVVPGFVILSSVCSKILVSLSYTWFFTHWWCLITCNDTLYYLLSYFGFISFVCKIHSLHMFMFILWLFLVVILIKKYILDKWTDLDIYWQLGILCLLLCSLIPLPPTSNIMESLLLQLTHPLPCPAIQGKTLIIFVLGYSVRRGM